MLRGGANLRSIRLRQVHDKAIVGAFERERIPTRRLCGAGRRADFGDSPDLVALVVNLMRDGAARADAVQNEIVVNDVAGQQCAAESGTHACGPVAGAGPSNARAPGWRLRRRRGPGGAGDYARIRPRHGDLGDDWLASKEQRLNNRTRAGRAAG